MKKKIYKIKEVQEFLIAHIIQGDKIDGIPNFLSDDNCFVDGIRQKSIMTSKLNSWVKQEKNEICTTDTMKKNWERNEKLINFDFIPEYIVNNIKSVYSSSDITTGRNTIYNFMISAKMRQLINYIDDFMIGQKRQK